MSNFSIIGICGGSCSGKTTFARRILESLGPDRCALVYQDSYYIDQSNRFKEDGGEVNFDHPESLDFALLASHLRSLKRGLGVDIPVYDFVTHSRQKNTERIEARPLILVDGTLLLSQPLIRPCLDESVFLECPEELRFNRRKRRDTQERGRTEDGVVRQFSNHVKPMHDQFVEKSKDFATDIVRCPSDFDTQLKAIIARLSFL